jgi:UDP-N-acetylmuramoyl-tripeptide--D-alanyl-D-alanine ligase
MLRGLLTLYSWRLPVILVYMLQNTEYHAGPYLKWFWQTTHFERVMYRRTLQRTHPARMLLLAVRAGMALEVLAGFGLVLGWAHYGWNGGLYFGIALLLATPIVWAHLAVLPLELGRLLIIRPRQARAIRASRPAFANFKGVKIAVAGSYGKTTMKEMLLTVLSEGKKVAATPANKNVSISHAIFARKLTGDEDVLIIEYGEGQPGDVARFADITRPTHAVITGVAPAHLDRYKTLDRAARDIFSVGEVAPAGQVYVNADSPDALPYVQPGQQLYSEKNALGWKISDVKVGVDHVRFTMQKGKNRLELKSGLLGRHQVGPLAFVAALAHELGLTDSQIKKGIAAIRPFEHRMEPYRLSGAWIIDDTYNGNIEGVRVGTRLLKDLPAQRRIYVTPGLVDQGKDTAQIHERMGELIAGSNADMVVLMQHSVTPHIQRGLEKAGFKGELLLESDPLNFYNNLNLFVAAGDVVLMQNDWPDNYS